MSMWREGEGEGGREGEMERERERGIKDVQGLGHGRGDLEAKDNGLNLEHLEFGVCVSH